MLVAVDRVEQLKEQLNEACLDVHKILYLKDKKQVLQAAINRGPEEAEQRGRDLVTQIYRNRLRSLDACEKRAAKCREDIENEKRELENAKHMGLEAQKKQQYEQNKAELTSLETKIATHNHAISRLQGQHLMSLQM